MADERERLERYLEWQRAKDAERAAWQRRRLGRLAVVVSVGAVAVGLAVWLTERPPGAPARVTTVTVPRSTSPAGLAAMPTAPVTVTPPSAPERATVEAPPTSTPRHQPRALRRPAVPPPPRLSPPAVATDPPAVTPSADRLVTTPDVVEPTPPPVEAGVAEQPAAAPPPSASAAAAHAAPTPPATEPPVTVTAAPTRFQDRVGRWVEGEVQELRDGVRREIDEFRSGVEKVRDFFRRRDARSPARSAPAPTG